MNLSIIAMLTSCFEEDKMVAPHEQGDLKTGTVELGKTYYNQVFYDLSTNSNISSNIISDWDLALECDKDNWHIILNSAQMMYAGNTEDTSFTNVTSSVGLNMKFDASDGNMDSTAIAEWYYTNGDTMYSYNQVYIIDRGMDENFNNNGKKKMTIGIKDGKYILRYADLNGANEETIELNKCDAFQYIYFSFDNGIVNIAPGKDQWSLKFTKYATMLITDDGDNYPYLVTGALLNPNNVTVALDTNDFFNINIQDTINYQFSKSMDFIGYDWKYYSFDDEMYTIVPDKNYIIKNYDGTLFKLRFIDFYDNSGNKGTITFEVVRL